jgi:prevent-host-death family protein
MALEPESGYNGVMRYKVGIRDLRDSLSRWLEKVKRGHVVEVTDHGRTVAVLSAPKPPRKARTEEEHLDRLEAEGLLIQRGTGWKPFEPLRIKGVDLSKAILEDREDRF